MILSPRSARLVPRELTRARATHGARQGGSRVRGKVWQCVSGERLGTFVGTFGKPARCAITAAAVIKALM